MKLLDATIIANSKGGTIFANLDVGERFTFRKHDSTVFVKTSRSWYSPVDGGRKFRTGSGSTVYLATKESA